MQILDNISDILLNFNIEWSTSDYFILPDIAIPLYPEDKVFYPNFFALFICEAGEMSFILNDALIEIIPFTLYAFCPENKVKSFKKSPDCIFRALFFTKDFLVKNNFKSNAIEDFKFFANGTFNKISLKQEEIESFLQLYDLLNKKKDTEKSIYYLEIIRSLFYTFLYEAQAIYAKDFTSKESFSRRENDLYNKFTKLIKAQAIMRHNLQFYANSLFITPKYLISAIKNASGKTPGVLINETIIEEAKHYLVHSDLPVIEIADRLQFTDIATFSKFFKRYTTLSPSAYRKNSSFKSPDFLTNTCDF
jgi:AraC-like DNA-binding protein